MKPFSYTKAEDSGAAAQTVGRDKEAKFLGGGTNLVDLMKLYLETPDALVDVSRLNQTGITELPNNGGVRIGAGVKNSDLASHPLIRARYPVLSEALLSGATGQIRNMASTGGNLLQRTRCPYFYDPAFTECNKKTPGSGCAAIKGINRNNAILGQSEACIATHPSDMAVAMQVLDAQIVILKPDGKTRTIAINDFHRLPGKTPQIETNLEHGELITAIDLPASAFAARSHYVKVRDRASYAFALVSAAVALDMDTTQTIRAARVAFGGVAHKPWRSMEAEKVLVGQKTSPELFAKAAEAAMKNAKAYEYNDFKPELARRTLVRALTESSTKEMQNA